MREPVFPDPRIPYVHGRDLVPIRTQPRRFRNVRHEQLFAEEDGIRRRIERIDRDLVDLADERKRLLDELCSLHEQLRPSYGGCRGRRRRVVSHEEPLPPAHDDARWLSGRELRSICLAFLRTAGRAVTLRMLHVVLHRAGYAVDHPHPGKALADALGHDADVGRAVRVARGTYAAAARGAPGAAAEAGGTATIPDW